jgi:hypothetical protein
MKRSSVIVSQKSLFYGTDIILQLPNAGFVVRKLTRLWAIFRFLGRFDVIHFNSGISLASAYAFEFVFFRGIRCVVRQTYSAEQLGL